MQKRMFALILSVMLALSLAACSSSGEAAPTLENKLSIPGTEDGVLTVGMECQYAPYNWTQLKDTNGAVPIANNPGSFANGYDVMIAGKICEAYGWELEIMALEWGGLTPALNAGTIDVAIAGQSMTAERMKEVDMVGPYYYATIVCLTTKDSVNAQAGSIYELSGNCTAQSGTIWYNSCLPQIPNASIQAAAENAPNMIMQLESGTVDFVCTDLPTANGAAAMNEDLVILNFSGTEGDFQFADETERSENVNIGVSVKKGNAALQKAIGDVLSPMTEEDFNALMDQAVAAQPSTDKFSDLFRDMGQLWKEYWPAYLTGICNTLILAVVATVIGCMIGLICGVVNTIPCSKQDCVAKRIILKLIRAVVRVYVEVFRGTPMVLQAVFIYFGLPYFTNAQVAFRGNSGMWIAAIVVVSINTGAYMAESVRGGIISVDPGQTEGAKAIGMNHVQTMLHVIMPQAIRNIIPQIGNNFIINIKDTSVMFVIGFIDFFAQHRNIIGINNMNFPSAAIEMIGYLCLTLAASFLLRCLEKKMDGADNYELVQGDPLVMTAGTYRHPKRGSHFDEQSKEFSNHNGSTKGGR